jgi:hypothetical protein
VYAERCLITIYIHTTHWNYIHTYNSLKLHTYIPLTLYSRKGCRCITVSHSSETPTFYHNYLGMSNTADVTGGKPIAVWSQSISSVNAINHLMALYDIQGRKREVLFFYFVLDTTRDWNCNWKIQLLLNKTTAKLIQLPDSLQKTSRDGNKREFGYKRNIIDYSESYIEL